MKKIKKMIIKLDHKAQFKLDNPHEHFQNVSRGCGSIKPKKGKGSYSRIKKGKGVSYE